MTPESIVEALQAYTTYAHGPLTYTPVLRRD